LTLGPAEIGPGSALAALFGYGDEADVLILQQLRLPRTLLAAMIGATLALSGAQLQGFMRNPLAAPDILGAPGFAAVFAVVLIVSGGAGALSFAVPVAAVAGALASVAALLALAGPRAAISTIILAGLALSSLAGALIALALNLAPNPYAALEIAFWLLGSLEDRGFHHIAIATPFLAISWLLLLSHRRGLTALALGADVARSSGIDVQRLQTATLVGVAAGVGGSVAVAGIIGFVGLITPHLVRPMVGNDPARVHVPAMLAGAALLLAADCLVRILPAAGEIHIGVVTALVGVPFFLWLILVHRARDLVQRAGGTE
jgi:iron complex transport system permease protein